MTSHSSPYAAVRELIPMAQVAERYGFSISRGGFIACPFHGGDDTPSLKIYNGSRGWHCFGCGEGGDVIDFVRRLFNLDARAALAQLNDDFGLGLVLDGRAPDPHATAKIARERREKQKRKDVLESQINALCAEHRRLHGIIISQRPPAQEWFVAVGKIEYVKYQIDVLQKQESGC